MVKPALRAVSGSRRGVCNLITKYSTVYLKNLFLSYFCLIVIYIRVLFPRIVIPAKLNVSSIEQGLFDCLR